MQRSKVEVFIHLVWATHERRLFINPTVEKAVYSCVRSEVANMKCETLALNGMPDHVHLVVSLHATVAVARLVQRVKGLSSQLANDELGFEGLFKWQDHYASFSISRPHLKRVIEYVDRQKERHSSGNLWLNWEETSAERDEGD